MSHGSGVSPVYSAPAGHAGKVPSPLRGDPLGAVLNPPELRGSASPWASTTLRSRSTSPGGTSTSCWIEPVRSSSRAGRATSNGSNASWPCTRRWRRRRSPSFRGSSAGGTTRRCTRSRSRRSPGSAVRTRPTPSALLGELGRAIARMARAGAAFADGRAAARAPRPARHAVAAACTRSRNERRRRWLRRPIGSAAPPIAPSGRNASASRRHFPGCSCTATSTKISSSPSVASSPASSIGRRLASTIRSGTSISANGERACGAGTAATSRGCGRSCGSRTRNERGLDADPAPLETAFRIRHALALVDGGGDAAIAGTVSEHLAAI